MKIQTKTIHASGIPARLPEGKEAAPPEKERKRKTTKTPNMSSLIVIQPVDQCKSELLEKLRLPESRRNLMFPVLIDRDTREANGDLWLKVISDLYPLT